MPTRTIYSEPTEQGEQTLAPGIRPITQKGRLQLLWDAPLRPRRSQKSLSVGLFDEVVRSQLDMFTQTQTHEGEKS